MKIILFLMGVLSLVFIIYCVVAEHRLVNEAVRRAKRDGQLPYWHYLQIQRERRERNS